MGVILCDVIQFPEVHTKACRTVAFSHEHHWGIPSTMRWLDDTYMRCTFAETFVIPGSCQALLPTELATAGIPDGMVEPATGFSTRHGLLVAQSLSIVQSRMVLVRVLNPSSAPVAVYRNQKVGVLHPLANTDNVNYLEPQECPLPTSEEHSHLQSLLEDFSDVFSLGDGDIVRIGVVRHKINTVQASPIRQPARRLPYHQRREMQNQLSKMSSGGV